MARPKKAIDPAEIVRELAAVGSTREEIATITGISARTLMRRFAAALERGGADMNVSLRRRQFELAMAGNPTMLIWLGKQRLGQRDVPMVEPDAQAAPRGTVLILPHNNRMPLEDLERLGAVATPEQVRRYGPSEQ